MSNEQREPLAPKQEIIFPPGIDQVKTHAIADGQLHYDHDGKFLFALAPNGKPSHLKEQQWLLSRTPWIKDWLRWEYVFNKAGGRILDRKNFGSELERIALENPVPELRALAGTMIHNPSLSQKSHVLYSDRINGSNYSLGHVLDVSELTGKLVIASQSLIMPQSPPEDIFVRKQVDVDETTLHEQVHCYTNLLIGLYDIFSKDNSLDELKEYTSDASVEFVRKVMDLFTIYKANSGLLNIHEFLAYGLTDIKPEARAGFGIKALKSMSYSGDKTIINAIATEALSGVGIEGSLYNELFSHL